jgi:hypothetical protein
LDKDLLEKAEQMATVSVIILLAIWFGASVLGQIDYKLSMRLRAHDHFSLIPRWTFFAPRPGTSDYHLLYHVDPDDGEHRWHEEQLADPRTVLGSVWNPLKRNKKALSDAVRSLGRLSKELEGENLWQVQYSVPYLAALCFLSWRPQSPTATHIRFMILESDGFYAEREPRLLFLSARHSLI